MNKKKQQTNAMPPLVEKDDALFEALGKNKKKKKRKIIRTILIIVIVLALILTVGVAVLRRRVREQFHLPMWKCCPTRLTPVPSAPWFPDPAHCRMWILKR